MAKIKLDVTALESELDKISQELTTIAADVEAGGVEGEAAIKLIKAYQKLLDKNTYLLVQRANLKLGVNATAPGVKEVAAEGGTDGKTESDAAGGASELPSEKPIGTEVTK